MNKPIYIIGHKNPDSDSICSAIGYAHLKRKQGISNVIPARAGKINAETKFILEYFNVDIPVLISDLHPCVRDVMIQEIVYAHPWYNLREIYAILSRSKIKSLPIVDENINLLGMLSIGDIAALNFNKLGIYDLQDANVTVEGVVRSVDGKVLCGTKEALTKKVTAKVHIAGSSVKTLTQKMEKGGVVIVGDRTNAQIASIESNVACIIVTSAMPIDEQIIQMAKEKDIVLVTCPHDTYTCGQLINQAVPVYSIMKQNIKAFKPSDMISDIRKIIAKTGFRNYPVVEDGKLVGMVNRNALIAPEKEQVILVDHTEKSQAVEGIEEAKILEIIDHHRLGTLETSEAIFIRHEPVGSTATIIANMHWHRSVAMSPKISGILLSAIISDTLLLKSPTCTPYDVETASKLAEMSGLDLNEFGMAVLKAGAAIDEKTPTDIAHNDKKEFSIGEYKVTVGQVSVLDAQAVLEKKEALLNAMECSRVNNKIDIALLMLTDILEESTYLLYTGAGGQLIEDAFAKEGIGNVLYLPGVVSRKKQIIPQLIAAAKKNS